MSTYVIGTGVRLSVEVRDASGAAVTPSGIVLKVKAPNNAVTTPSVTSSATGDYYGLVTTALVGEYYYRWETTTPTTAIEGQFTVIASGVI